MPLQVFTPKTVNLFSAGKQILATRKKVMNFRQTNCAVLGYERHPNEQIKSLPISMIDRDLIVKNVLKNALILFLVEKEIVF